MAEAASHLKFLADDGSLHVFPAGTSSGTIANTLDSYHASLAQPVANSSAAQMPTSIATNPFVADKQPPSFVTTNARMRGGDYFQLSDRAAPQLTAAPPNMLAGAGPIPRVPVPQTGVGGFDLSAPPLPNLPASIIPRSWEDVSKSYDGRPIGPVPGYPETARDAWRAGNDVTIRNAVSDFDDNAGLSPGQPGYITPQLAKAWAMRESGSEGDQGAFQSDPFQVNNPADWDKEKTDPRYAGLVKYQAMTPETSAPAALLWLNYKGRIADKKLGAYRGDYQALKAYNGKKYPLVGGQFFNDDYASQVLAHANAMLNGTGH